MPGNAILIKKNVAQGIVGAAIAVAGTKCRQCSDSGTAESQTSTTTMVLATDCLLADGCALKILMNPVFPDSPALRRTAPDPDGRMRTPSRLRARNLRTGAKGKGMSTKARNSRP